MFTRVSGGLLASWPPGIRGTSGGTGFESWWCHIYTMQLSAEAKTFYFNPKD